MQEVDASRERKRPRALVVDDDQYVGLLVRLNLEQYGYDVIVRQDGVGGLLVAQTLPVDVIVLDLMMPLVDGFQVLAELKADARTRDVPVIVLTAVSLAKAQQQAKDQGAYAVVTKPFDADRFMNVVEAAVGAHFPVAPSSPA